MPISIETSILASYAERIPARWEPTGRAWHRVRFC